MTVLNSGLVFGHGWQFRRFLGASFLNGPPCKWSGCFFYWPRQKQRCAVTGENSRSLIQPLFVLAFLAVLTNNLAGEIAPKMTPFYVDWDAINAQWIFVLADPQLAPVTANNISTKAYIGRGEVCPASKLRSTDSSRSFVRRSAYCRSAHGQ